MYVITYTTINGNTFTMHECFKDIAYKLYFKFRSMGDTVKVHDPNGKLLIGRE